jgi:hypothetical protein
LLHFDGANNSTTFTDSSSYAHAVTAADNAVISTTQSKFGGASGYFDGDGDGVTVPDGAEFAFGSGNFTIEAWVWPINASTAVGGIYGQRQGGSGDGYGIVLYVLNGSTHLVVSESGTDWNINFSGEVPVVSGEWSHIALVRNGNNWTVYVNGVVSQTINSSIAVHDANGSPSAGNAGFAGQYFYGYIDDLRVTKGVARYTAPFTPPDAPFPNSGPALPTAPAPSLWKSETLRPLYHWST